MRFLALFLVVHIQLYHIHASPPDLPGVSTNRAAYPGTVNNQDPAGYECGNVFFSDLEISTSLAVALASVDKGFPFPETYHGKLYPEAKYKEYLLWPIRKGLSFLPHFKLLETTFRIVFTRDIDEGIDFVAKITTNDYTRCIRRGRPHLKMLTPVSENSNAYLCGHKFITDEFIKEYLPKALSKIRKKGLQLAPYTGSLYPQDIELGIVPIFLNNLRKSGNGNDGPEFLVISERGEFIDAVVRGFGGNLLRCIRSRKPPKAPESDPHSKLFVPPPTSGYQCGKTFFDDKALEDDAQIAKTQMIKGQYPKAYSGPPFYEPCLILPLFKDGGLFQKGNRGPYRLILTNNYKVRAVALYINGKFDPCERKTMAVKKNHDISDYICKGQNFSHLQLVQAAEEACKWMNNKKKCFFPARYEGPDFEIDGPYLTFPILPDGRFKCKPGLHRVVINTRCEVVGALTTPKIQISKSLIKCHRLKDGPLKVGFFDRSTEPISEHRITY